MAASSIKLPIATQVNLINQALADQWSENEKKRKEIQDTIANFAADVLKPGEPVLMNGFKVLNPWDPKEGWVIDSSTPEPTTEEMLDKLKQDVQSGRVHPLFAFHKLNAAGIEKAQRIAKHFTWLLGMLELQCPVTTREFSIVKTKLEEAAFFAKKSMANDAANQESK